MRNFIIYSLFLSGLLAFSARAETPRLQENAPNRYVVVPGDTLWGISARFLKDPWKWPQVWGMNREEIENPHLIYPGDVIVLETVDGIPRLKVEKPASPQPGEEERTVRLSPGIQIRDLGRAIPSIPLTAIGPFLSRTQIVSRQAWEDAPRIVAGEEGSVILGAGESGYASGLPSGKSVSWDIYGKGRELADPESGKPLGFEVDYLGEAKLVRPGNPAKIEVVRSVREIGVGSRLLPVFEQTVTHFVPHAPDRPIKGRILSTDGYVEIGQNDIVAVNLGSRDGLELGDVLAVSRAGKTVDKLKLPDLRVGLVMVFRIYDTVSYALVVQSVHSIHASDTVQTP